MLEAGLCLSKNITSLGNLTLSGGELNSTEDQIKAGGVLNLSSGGDLSLLASKLKGEKGLGLTALGDLALKAKAEEGSSFSYRVGDVRFANWRKLSGQTSLESGGDLSLAGRNISLEAAKLSALGKTTLRAEEEIRIKDFKTLNAGSIICAGKKTITEKSSQSGIVQSEIKSGDDLRLSSSGNTEIISGNIFWWNLSISTGRI